MDHGFERAGVGRELEVVHYLNPFYNIGIGNERLRLKHGYNASIIGSRCGIVFKGATCLYEEVCA